MTKTSSYISTEQGSDKSFGIVFSMVFLVLAVYPLIDSKELHIWALIVSVILLFLAFVTPKIFVIPNKIWFKVISPLEKKAA